MICLERFVKIKLFLLIQQISSKHLTIKMNAIYLLTCCGPETHDQNWYCSGLHISAIIVIIILALSRSALEGGEWAGSLHFSWALALSD